MIHLNQGSTLLYWPEHLETELGEQILIWQTEGGKEFRLASNFPYEVWLDGLFVGDGGLRCAPGEALLDTWNAREASTVWLRMHFMDSAELQVWYRTLFDDPFLADLDGNIWECFLDDSIRFGGKVISQLPRQNIVSGPPRLGAELEVDLVSPDRPWVALDSGLRPARFVLVDAEERQTHPWGGQENEPFAPHRATNITLYIRNYVGREVWVTTFDLGQIVLHRFEITTEGPVALCYGEVPSLRELAATPNRRKVRLADACAPATAQGAPFGTRGCRYVHVIHEKDQPFSLKAYRREYPLKWKPVFCKQRKFELIRQACQRNLVACVDGGVVDTCWRERAQWVGDLRMSALALRELADNPEIVANSLWQIATSYDEQWAMVQGAWPIKTPDHRELLMPTYHLAFCLTVLEHCPDDAQLVGLARSSLERWGWQYLRDGLLRDLPGWHFTDWDPVDEQAHRNHVRGTHAVVNAWYHEACQHLGLDSIDLEAYDATFWLESAGAYRLTADTDAPSPQATAAALGSLPTRKGMSYLVGSKNLSQRVTPYFGYFVARAIGKISMSQMYDFIGRFYGPMAARYGTLLEKTGDGDSLAHGWSVAVAALLPLCSRENDA